MELARVFSSPDVQTERSIPLHPLEQRGDGTQRAPRVRRTASGAAGQGIARGSKKYPEPKWLGMIQHDMMMWDHGMPRADGTVSKEQRPRLT
jgi:hypothetical protein